MLYLRWLQGALKLLCPKLDLGAKNLEQLQPVYTASLTVLGCTGTAPELYKVFLL
jgi:hypothetical protein